MQSCPRTAADDTLPPSAAYATTIPAPPPADMLDVEPMPPPPSLSPDWSGFASADLDEQDGDG